MSNVSNRHAVTPYTAGESKPFSGQRLAVARYKQTDAMTKRGEVAPAAVCASVPFLPVADIKENIDALLPHICNMLESAQDGILRSLYEGSSYSITDLNDADISVQACIGFMEAASTGSGKLSGEAIKAWFTQHVEENLTVFIADKLGFADLTPENLVVVQKHVGIYKDIAAMLSGTKTILETKQRKSVRVAIGLADIAGEAMAKRLIARLDAMEAPAKNVEFLEL
jgi:SpoU rRNA methylase family enzyme